jgi:hypothetical protein
VEPSHTETGHDLTLSREDIIELLTMVGAHLEADEVRGELFVVVGAAMALAYNTRRLTADVDGVFEPKSEIYDAARAVAQDRKDLPVDWLNDAVKSLLPGADPDARVVLTVPGLTVSVPSPRYLLALKVQAARIDRDADDIVALAHQCGATTADEVLDVAADVIGATRLQPKDQFLIQQLFQ